MNAGKFTLTVERIGEDGFYRMVVANGAGRRWVQKNGSPEPDNIGEAMIETAWYIGEGGKLNADFWVAEADFDLYEEKVADWNSDIEAAA